MARLHELKNHGTIPAYASAEMTVDDARAALARRRAYLIGYGWRIGGADTADTCRMVAGDRWRTGESISLRVR